METSRDLNAPASEKHDPFAAFRHRSFALYAGGNFASIVGRQMVDVVVGWEIYQRTQSAAMLGYVGLAAGLPIILFALPAGHLTDRVSRRGILMVTQVLTALFSLGLAWASLTEAPIGWMYLLLFLSSSARTFGWTARSALVPNLVPLHEVSNASMWSSTMFQLGSVIGPALCGLLILQIGYSKIYLVDALTSLAFFASLFFVRPLTTPVRQAAVPGRGIAELFSGVRFVFRNRIVLGTITLDLFAVLLGGATMLLPVFAEKILHCGPVGLGWLRAAPGIGAILMGAAIAFLPPMQKPGKAMLLAVIGFGLATIVFGLSKSFWLSITMLFLTGAFDTISVIVRHSLVQILTPDPMRGRVSAVNNVFIGSSNEIGAFESGMTAAWFGPVMSVVGGGIGTVLVVFAVAAAWPEIRKIGNLNSLRPAE
jgi:MFS family permease